MGGPGCSVDTLENCSDDQKAQLDEYINMPAEERDAKLADLKKKMGDAEKAHEDLLKTLQSTYKESMDSLEKLKETSAPTIKLLRPPRPRAPSRRRRTRYKACASALCCAIDGRWAWADGRQGIAVPCCWR